MTAHHYPPLFVAAWLLFALGLLGLLALALVAPALELLKPALLFALALLAFGGGEILNHPRERVVAPPGTGSTAHPSFQRRRNTCALGNLSSIIAIVLFFLAIAALPGFS